MASSLSDILSAVQNGVIALNNMAVQIKGSFNNILSRFVTDEANIATNTTNITTNTTNIALNTAAIAILKTPAGFAAHKDSVDQTGLLHAAYNGVTWPAVSDNTGSYFDTTNNWWTPPAGYAALKAAVWQSQNAQSAPTPTFTLKILREHVGVTISFANPGVVGWPLHGLAVNRPVQLFGLLPTGLVSLTVYYVKTVIDANSFTVAAAIGGAAINTTSAGTPPFTGFCDVAAGIGTGCVGAAGQAIAQVGHEYAYSNGTDHFIVNFYTTSSTAANNGVLDGNPAHTHFSGHWISV